MAKSKILWLAGFLTIPSAQAFVGYALKQGFRQGSILLRAKPIDSYLSSGVADGKDEHFLRLSRDILRFARAEGGLESKGNYERYVKLDRPWVVQVVTAAAPDKMDVHHFDFPIVGSFPYKGFFDEGDAIEEEQRLKAQGFDTYRRGAEAFSSLGWFSDPVLSTMFDDEAHLMMVLFHELTHANVYVKSEADFNEALADWVSFELSGRFLKSLQPQHPSWLGAAETQLAATQKRLLALGKTVPDILKMGKAFYAQPGAVAKRAEFFKSIQERFGREPVLQGYAKVEWNNARILGLATYTQWFLPIQSYAQEKKLDVKAMMAEAVADGPALVEKIRARLLTQ